MIEFAQKLFKDFPVVRIAALDLEAGAVTGARRIEIRRHESLVVANDNLLKHHSLLERAHLAPLGAAERVAEPHSRVFETARLASSVGGGDLRVEHVFEGRILRIHGQYANFTAGCCRCAQRFSHARHAAPAREPDAGEIEPSARAADQLDPIFRVRIRLRSQNCASGSERRQILTERHLALALQPPHAFSRLGIRHKGRQDIAGSWAAPRAIIALLCFLVMFGGPHRRRLTRTGVIEDMAEDVRGQPLPGVELVLRATKGRIVSRATSRPDGRYRFAGVAAGDYSVSGEKEGFATATAAVTVRAGERLSADFALAPLVRPAAVPPAPSPPPAPGPVGLEEVNVLAKRLEAARAAIEPQIGASTYTVTRQAIEAQPGGDNNTLNQVVLQAPGVSQDAELAGGIHVRNEMQPEEFRINGIPLPIGLSYFGQGLSPRFANSFTLITGALPAQYGLSTSGVIDIQTKSGLLAPGGLVSMYGGGYDTLQPSAEYGGSIDGYNYYVSGDFFSTSHRHRRRHAGGDAGTGRFWGGRLK